ncbi:MAG: hypothetical protein JXR48_11180 [Candidatus Delongbacteria bacterium]|nr:hypothetical protein [Candidatus Delongbacteria bacterium]
MKRIIIFLIVITLFLSCTEINNVQTFINSFNNGIVPIERIEDKAFLNNNFNYISLIQDNLIKAQENSKDDTWYLFTIAMENNKFIIEPYIPKYSIIKNAFVLEDTKYINYFNCVRIVFKADPTIYLFSIDKDNLEIKVKHTEIKSILFFYDETLYKLGLE